MKIIAGYIAGFVTAISLAASAAVVTITTDTAQDTRLVPAFTALLQPGCPGACRNATAADVKAWIINQLQGVVRNYEYEQQKATITTQSFTPT